MAHERTITFEADGRHIVIPTVVGGRELSTDDAISQWRAGRNRELGAFGSADEAERFATSRSEQFGEGLGLQDGPMRLYDDDRANAESSILTAPSSGIGLAPAGGARIFDDDAANAAVAEGSMPTTSAGIGLAPVRGEQAVAQAPREEIGVWQAMKESFTPVANAREARRKERESKINEFKTQADALKVGIELLNESTGDERAQFITSYKARLDKLDPGLGDTFASLAERPDAAAEVMQWGQDSESLKRAFEVGGIKGVRKLLTSPDALKTIQAEIDGKRLPVLMKKAQAFITGWQHIVPPEMVEDFNKDGRLSASELARGNEWIKTNKPELVKGLGISDRDWGVINRNSDAFYGALDMISPKDETEVRKKKAIDDDKGKPPPSRQIRRGTSIVNQEWQDGKWVEVGSGPAFKPDKPGALTASQERTNAEIDAARLRIEALSDDDIKRLTQKALDTGRENPSYDATVARDATLAGRRKFGDDPDHEKITLRVAGKREGQANEQKEYDRVVVTLTAQLAMANLSSDIRKDIQGRLDKAHALARKKGLKIKK